MGKHVDARNVRMQRPLFAQTQHVLDLLSPTLEHGLHHAVAPVAHPAGKTKTSRRRIGPGAVADTLHPSLDPHMNDTDCHRLCPLPKSHFALRKSSIRRNSTAANDERLKRRLRALTGQLVATLRTAPCVRSRCSRMNG